MPWRDFGDWSDLRYALAALIGPKANEVAVSEQGQGIDKIDKIDNEREEQSPLYVDSVFAREWYAMRERGEHDRAAALTLLYQNRADPGGLYPDPRLPAAFSNRAIIGAVAKLKGVSVWPAPSKDEHRDNHRHRVTVPVWLVTYATPRKRGERKEPPMIAALQQEEEDLMLWSVANMLGFITREPWRVSDPAAPAGATLLPSDPASRALFHRYAHALMLAEFDCGAVCGCACGEIERRLNTPPPDHEQPTTSIPSQRVNPIIAITDTSASKACKPDAMRANEHGVERGAERGAERANERGAERANERGVERANERGVERGAERGESTGHL